MNGFVQRLKERKLVQWTLAYVAAAFALLQGLDIVANRFDLPAQTMRLVILAMIVGFFVTLILAWYHGERGAQRVSGSELLILALLVAIGGVVLWRFGSSPHEGSPAAPVTAAVAAPAAIPPKSIAVLPFENLSHDPDNAYFSEGIQDEILTRLAKIADLKVISRTSTQRFKSSPDNVPEIARQLAVANILEGSVQKAGGQVRVNVQLIKADSDAHLWADTYDRQLTDIFAVESEIAKTVADMLQAKLNGTAAEVLASRPTDDPEAHELYLKGRYFWNRRTGTNLQKAAEYFQQAVEKDPNYALAYAGLADCHVLLPAYPELGSRPSDEFPKALAAARKAVALDDKLAEAHTSLARVLASTYQLPAAMTEFQRSLALNPRYATTHQWLGECLQSQGRLKEGLAELQRAQELDPLSLVINALLGFALDSVDKTDEAMAQFQKTLEMDPSFFNTHDLYGNVLEHHGRLQEAVVQYEAAHAIAADPIPTAELARAYYLVGRKAEAQKLWDQLQALAQRQYVPPYSQALVQLAFGNKDEAMRLLEQSYAEHAPFDTADLGWILIDHRLDPLRGDPRFKQLIDQILPGK